MNMTVFLLHFLVILTFSNHWTVSYKLFNQISHFRQTGKLRKAWGKAICKRTPIYYCWLLRPVFHRLGVLVCNHDFWTPPPEWLTQCLVHNKIWIWFGLTCLSTAQAQLEVTIDEKPSFPSSLGSKTVSIPIKRLWQNAERAAVPIAGDSSCETGPFSFRCGRKAWGFTMSFSHLTQ